MPGFLGNVINMDFFMSTGISPVSYIMFISFVISVMPRSSRATIASAGTPSGPVAFPCYITKLLVALISKTEIIDFALNDSDYSDSDSLSEQA